MPSLSNLAATLEPFVGFPVATVRAKAEGALDVESIPTVSIHDLADLRESREGSMTLAGALPIIFNGRIDPAGDEDRFTVVLRPTQRKLRIEVDAAESGSALDGVMQILNPKGDVLANADDTPLPEGGKKGRAAGLISSDPSLIFDVPADLSEITIALKDLSGRGGIGFPYRIKVEPVSDDFEVVLNNTEVNVPRGGTAEVGATVTRRGWNGPIRLEVPNLPPGLSVRPGIIPDGQVVGTLTLTATDDASFDPLVLDVIGRADGPQGPISDRASKTIMFAMQAAVPVNSMTQVGLMASPSLPASISLDAPSTPIEVAHGFNAVIPITAKRSEGADGALAFSMTTPIPNLGVAASDLSEKGLTGSVTINTTTDLPLGFISIALVGKGKIGPADVSVSVPEATLQVVRPVVLELSTPSLEIKGGQTIEVKGKVARKAGFGEALTVKIDGLPAGIKGDPLTLSPDQTEFSLKLVAEEKAAAATASPHVGLGFQVAGKDYPFPPSPLALKVLPPD